MVRAFDLAWVGGDDWSALACLKKLGLINPAATCSKCGGEWALHVPSKGQFPYWLCQQITSKGHTAARRLSAESEDLRSLVHHRKVKFGRFDLEIQRSPDLGDSSSAQSTHKQKETRTSGAVDLTQDKKVPQQGALGRLFANPL